MPHGIRTARLKIMNHKIRVKTADELWAGTDDDVFIDIVGKNGRNGLVTVPKNMLIIKPYLFFNYYIVFITA